MEPVATRDVAPLELFFDLVFVFAVSQQSGHLLTHLTGIGAMETLVLLCAVFTVWVHTSFEATFFDITRRQTQVAVHSVQQGRRRDVVLPGKPSARGVNAPVARADV